MAIIVEEEKKPVNWFSLIATIAFVVLIFAAVYYLFFSRPEFIEVIVPIRLEEAANLSKISFDPGALINSPAFKNLRPYGTVPSPGELGRPNPFLPF